MKKLKFSTFIFSILLKVSRSFRVDLVLEEQWEVVYVYVLLSSSASFSGHYSYTLCIVGHFKPAHP